MEGEIMDVALALGRLIPSAEYFGSLTENSLNAYDNISWMDSRIKPSWAEIIIKWESIKDEPAPLTLEERLAALEQL
jgi:hypothetical protein